MFKGQGQTAGLCTKVVHSIPFDSFAWKLPNLDTVDAHIKEMFPIDSLIDFSKLVQWLLLESG